MLAYYRNGLTHILFNEAVVMTALVSFDNYKNGIDIDHLYE